MHTIIALTTVIFLAIWAQDLGHRDGAGSWQRVPGVQISR